jgi:hypothetical protein
MQYSSFVPLFEPKKSDYQYTESEKQNKDEMTNSWEINLEQAKQSELIYQEKKKLKINELIDEWKKKLDKLVYDNDLVELKNDYFGMNHYYYDHKHSRMYKIYPCDYYSEHNADSILRFDTDDDNHVLELNNIKSSPLIFQEEGEKASEKYFHDDVSKILREVSKYILYDD